MGMGGMCEFLAMDDVGDKGLSSPTLVNSVGENEDVLSAQAHPKGHPVPEHVQLARDFALRQ